jgi:hypothetical protein
MTALRGSEHIFTRVRDSNARRTLVEYLRDDAAALGRNEYGLVLSDGLPVICGCGGSLFLCKRHADELVGAP